MNKLNVFKYGYLPWSRPINWLRNVRQFFRNIRYAYQRVTRGYSDFDLWGLSDFYRDLFRTSLMDFQKDLHGAPPEFYDEETDSIERWKDYIKEMATLFDRSCEDSGYYVNEFDELAQNNYCFEDGKFTYKDKELKDKWFAREKEVLNSRQADFDKAWNMLYDKFDNLWD